jgi:hypothetical protein
MESPQEETTDSSGSVEQGTNGKRDGGCLGALLLPGILLLGLGFVPIVLLVRESMSGNMCKCGTCGLMRVLSLAAGLGILSLGSLCMGLSGRALGYRFGKVFLWVAGVVGGPVVLMALWVLWQRL